MIRIMSYAVLLAVFAAFVFGCSASEPVTTPMEPVRLTSTDSHELLGYYRLMIDPSIPSVEILPVRQIEIHKNVKQFVSPPACLDCIIIQPTGPYSNNILPIDVTLKNPTALKGFDIRGIFIVNDFNVRLENPDAMTELYDDGGAITINPFRAFAKEVPNRAFGAGLSYTESFEIYLSKFGKVGIIDYAVDASFPGRAVEPYDIANFTAVGDVDDLGTNVVQLEVDVSSANDNVDEVLMDATVMGFGTDIAFTQGAGNQWTANFSNDFKLPPGEYQCQVRASTSASNLYLYTNVTITVVEAVISFSGQVQPLLDQYCTTCHGSVAPPLGLDLSPGNSYSNIVSVASVQSTANRVEPDEPALSYLWGKILGIHDGLAFGGSGDRMPKNGPPYLADEEVLLITGWISGGALDN